jgi:hypothetical protein
MWSRFPRSGSGLAGAILIIGGTFATLLGFLGAINHSETCYVLPSFGGCVSYYQVSLFAPLYHVSAVVIILGAIIAVSGIMLTVASSAIQPSHTANRGDTPQPKR